MSRKLVFRQIRQLKWSRSLSTNSAATREFVVKSALNDVVIPKMNILDRLWLDAPEFKNHVAVECAETKKRYTYLELQKYVAVFASFLHKSLGLRQGDVVAAMLPNCPEFLVAYLGTLRAGCVLTTVNPVYKEFELTHQVVTTEPKLIITVQECYGVVVKSLKGARHNSKIVIVDKNGAAVPDGALKFSEIENGDADDALLNKINITDEDLALIPFSSGTTGLPKGVQLTHRNLKAALEMMSNEHICFSYKATADFQDIVPCILPFFHIYGLIVAITGHLSKGCKLVTMTKFSTQIYFDILKNQKATLLYVVPPIAILLGKHPDVTAEHLRHARHLVCGAAPLSASDAEAILAKSKGKVKFGQGYGLTETTSMGSSHIVTENMGDFSSCGVLLPSLELKVVDPMSGLPLPLGKCGELHIRGPSVTRGYHKNEKATRESLTDDGFFKTGDMGYYDPVAGLYVTDRVKELIKVKGMQVAPAELEGLLRSHPAVQEAAVVGVPHEYFGEVPKAFIVPKKNQKPTPEEIKHFVADKVAAYKKIEEVMFVNDIPKTASGKILRKDLKKMYA